MSTQRRWYLPRFSLRMLLVVVTLVCAFLGWGVPRWQMAVRQRDAMANYSLGIPAGPRVVRIADDGSSDTIITIPVLFDYYPPRSVVTEVSLGSHLYWGGFGPRDEFLPLDLLLGKQISYHFRHRITGVAVPRRSQQSFENLQRLPYLQYVAIPRDSPEQKILEREIHRALPHVKVVYYTSPNSAG